MYSTRIAWLIVLSTALLSYDLIGARAESKLPEAEVVWVANESGDNGKRVYSILYSSLNDDVWSVGEKIYSSTFPLTTPSIYSMNSAQKIAVWSELQTTKTVINYQLKRDGKWGQMSLLSDVGVENLGPSVIEDAQGGLWAFWSAHNNDNDDIYQSVFNGNSWSRARRVHNKNSVPDYGVSASMDEGRNIVLRWKSFSATLNRYQVAKEVIQAKGESKKVVGLNGDDTGVPDKSISDIVPPSFLPANALHIVHIPSNSLNKNFRINDR